MTSGKNIPARITNPPKNQNATPEDVVISMKSYMASHFKRYFGIYASKWVLIFLMIFIASLLEDNPAPALTLVLWSGIFGVVLLNAVYQAIIFLENKNKKNFDRTKIEKIKADYNLLFPYVYYRKSSFNAYWVTYGVVTLALLIAGFIMYPDLSANPILNSLSILIFLVVAILAFYFLHSWALIPTETLYSIAVRDKKQFIGEEKKREMLEHLGCRPCGYCGHDIAPIVCSECHKIQWIDISNPLQVDKECFFKNHNWNWPYAVFITHHRWQIIATILILTITGTLAFAMKIKDDQWNAEKKNSESLYRSTVASIDAMAEFRFTLTEIEVICNKETINEMCASLFRKMNQAYFRLSWYGPALLQLLYERNRCEKYDFEDCEDCSKYFQSPKPANQHLRNLIIACNMVQSKNEAGRRVGILEILDSKYRDYVENYRKCRVLSKVCKARVRSAVTFYQYGRVLGCLISTLGPKGTLPLKKKYETFVAYTDCSGHLDKFKLLKAETKDDSPLFWDKHLGSIPENPDGQLRDFYGKNEGADVAN